MSSITQQIVEMLNMLPEQEQQLAREVLKRLVLAWDPDYTKLTPAESTQVASAIKEFKAGEFVQLSEQWDESSAPSSHPREISTVPDPRKERDNKMNQEILFIIIDSAEGGYEASALGHSIFTQAETYDALKQAIRDALRCRFDEAEIPRVIHLHYVRDEVMAVCGECELRFLGSRESSHRTIL